MAVTRTDLMNMMNMIRRGAGRDAGVAVAPIAREIGQNTLASKRLKEQIEQGRQMMSLRERLADLQEREFSETLPLKKQQLQAEIDKTKNYIDYLNKTLGMREKELGMEERKLDYTLEGEGRQFTQNLFGLGYGTPEEREAYLREQTGGVFTTGPGGQPLGQSFLGGGTATGGGTAGGGAVFGGRYTMPVGSMPSGGYRGSSGSFRMLPFSSAKVNTTQTLSSSGTRGR